MSFLDRYEFEQILDEDLALNRNQWQAETEKESVSQPQSSTFIKVPIGRTILIGLTALGLGLGLLVHQPSLAHSQKSNSDVASNIQPK